jgi:hypothetical protein
VKVTKVFLCSLFFINQAKANTVKTVIDIGPDILYGVAKRYIMTQLFNCGDSASEVLRLEDPSAGILRFVYKDDRLKDENALIEIIENDANQSLMKVTLADYGPRTEVLKNKIVEAAKPAMEGGRTEILPFDSKKAFRSAYRYILKTFVVDKAKKEDVVCYSSEEVGLIRFKYKKEKNADSQARIEIIPAGKNASRIWATLPQSASDRQILLQDDLVAQVKSDLGEEKQDDKNP